MFQTLPTEVNLKIAAWLGKGKVNQAKEMRNLAQLDVKSYKIWKDLYQTGEITFFDFIRNSSCGKKKLAWDRLPLYMNGLSKSELVILFAKIMEIIPVPRSCDFKLDLLLCILKNEDHKEASRVFIYSIKDVEDLVLKGDIGKMIFDDRYEDLDLLYSAFKSVMDKFYKFKTDTRYLRLDHNIKVLRYLQTRLHAGSFFSAAHDHYLTAYHTIDEVFLELLEKNGISLDTIWFKELVSDELLLQFDKNLIFALDRDGLTKVDKFLKRSFDNKLGARFICNASRLLSLGAIPQKSIIDYIQLDLTKSSCCSQGSYYQEADARKVALFLEKLRPFIYETNSFCIINELIDSLKRKELVDLGSGRSVHCDLSDIGSDSDDSSDL
jgi:hypothetical protein